MTKKLERLQERKAALEGRLAEVLADMRTELENMLAGLEGAASGPSKAPREKEKEDAPKSRRGGSRKGQVRRPNGFWSALVGYYTLNTNRLTFTIDDISKVLLDNRGNLTGLHGCSFLKGIGKKRFVLKPSASAEKRARAMKKFRSMHGDIESYVNDEALAEQVLTRDQGEQELARHEAGGE